MTILTDTCRIDYAGDGQTLAFPVPFPFWGGSELQVSLVNPDLTVVRLYETASYAVTAGGNDAVGTVTLYTPPAVGQRLVILRETNRTQLADFVANDELNSDTLERSLDRLVAITAELWNRSEATVRGPDTDLPSELLPLPPASQRALQLFGFDAFGNPIAAQPTGALVSAAMQPVVAAGSTTQAVALLGLSSLTNPAQGAALIGYVAPYAGAVGHTVAQKLGRWLSPQDFGGDPTGGADSTTAITLAQVAALAARVPFVIDGLYRAALPLTINAPMTILAGGGFMQTAALTINAPMLASTSQIFFGSGVVSITHAAGIVEAYPEWWGAKGNFVSRAAPGTDDSAAFAAWYRVIATGIPGRLLAKNYYFASQMWWDVLPSQYTGITVRGAGLEQTILWFASTVPSPQFKVYSSGSDNFYHQLIDFGVIGYCDGITTQLFQEDFSDPANECVFRLASKNERNAPGSIGLEVNSILNSDCFFVANGGGTSAGNGGRFRQVRFNTFQGSFGNANTALSWAGGYSYGNTSIALDLEVCLFCMDSTVNTFTNNTAQNGTFVFQVSALNMAAGSSDVFDNCSYAPDGSGAGPIIANGVGVEIRGSLATLPVNTPGFPASGAPVVNYTGRRISVLIYAGNVTNVQRGGDNISNSVTGAWLSIPLEPRQLIAVTYSGASPGWVWSALA